MTNNKKYTKEQIQDSIAKWANIMLESGTATPEEIKDLLGEGLLGSLGSKIKNAMDSAKDGIKNAKEAIHDQFFTNAGVKKFIDCIEKAKKDGKEDLDAIKLVAVIGSEKYPVIDFDIPKDYKKTLALLINPEEKDLGKCTTVGTMRKTIKAAGIKKMSASLSGIVCGTAQVAPKEEPKKDEETAKVEPGVPDFTEAPPVKAQSGAALKIADKNKLLDVKYDKGFIGFMFDKSKEIKKAEQADDEIFS